MAPKIVFPYEFHSVPPGQDKSIKDGVYGNFEIINVEEVLQFELADRHGGLVRVGPENLVLPATFQKIAKDVYNLEPRSDDVWIATFIRSGTTVTTEMVWLIANNMDYEGAKVHHTERIPFLELEQFTIGSDIPSPNIISKLENATSQRIIKTHLTYSLIHPSLFTKGSKVIYVARNPKDVIVSCYHFHKFIPVKFDGDFETFFEYFITDSVMYGPYWEHILQGWENRHRPNYLFLFYEDLKKDVEGTIRKVAKFLEKQPTDEEIQKLKEHLDINNFKKNTAVNAPIPGGVEGVEGFKSKDGFVRKGEVKSWEKYFTPEMSEKVDQLMREKFDPVGLKFDC